MQPSSSHPLFYGLRLKYLDRIKDDFEKKDTLCSEERPWINAAMGVKDFNGVVNYFCEQSGLDAEKYTAMSFKLYSTPQVCPPSLAFCRYNGIIYETLNKSILVLKILKKNP